MPPIRLTKPTHWRPSYTARSSVAPAARCGVSEIQSAPADVITARVAAAAAPGFFLHDTLHHRADAARLPRLETCSVDAAAALPATTDCALRRSASRRAASLCD